MRKVNSLQNLISATTPSYPLKSINFMIITIHSLMRDEIKFIYGAMEKTAILVEIGKKNDRVNRVQELLMELQSRGHMIKGYSKQVQEVLSKFGKDNFWDSKERKILTSFEGFVSNEHNFLNGIAQRIAEKI